MQNIINFSKVNSYVVYPVYQWQTGLFADGKILYCESSLFFGIKHT